MEKIIKSSKFYKIRLSGSTLRGAKLRNVVPNWLLEWS